MSESNESGMDFGVGFEENLDIAAIFGGGVAQDVNPFAVQATPIETKESQDMTQQPEGMDMSPAQTSELDNPIETALVGQESYTEKAPPPTPQTTGSQLSLFDKLPVF